MAMKRTVQRALRRFRRDRRGNYGMMMAIVAPMLLVGAGFGINMAQLSNARSNLLAALDSAVTSTARDITIGVIRAEDADATVEAFLLANGQRAFSKGDRITLNRVVTDPFRKTVMAEASVRVDVAFPLFGAANQQTLTTVSEARYSDRKIEVAMMLDVTGSMAIGRDKIGELKVAAKAAVEALLDGNKHLADRVRVSLVPYAQSVNVGEKLAKSAVFYEENNGPVPPRGWTAPSRRNDYCATERKMQDGSPDYSDTGPDTKRTARDRAGNSYEYKALVNRDGRLVRDRINARECPAAAIVPLTSDKAALDRVINSFSADGVTAGGVAMQWGYYMLSPNWRAAISAAELGAGPADPDPDKIAKIAILMTDGEFNTAFAGVPSREKPQMDQQTRASTNAEEICKAMRKDGIEIFTIGFALPSREGAAAREVLQDCASPDTPLTKHFYEAATGDELKKVFGDIVRNIERLALTR